MNKRGFLGSVAIIIVLVLLLVGGATYLILQKTNSLEVSTGNVVFKVDYNDELPKDEKNETNNSNENFKIVELENLTDQVDPLDNIQNISS
tara:strand:+ start:953 stop:1225 length:273 start_codon:yes stop_codon:yes gene_type:complete